VSSCTWFRSEASNCFLVGRENSYLSGPKDRLGVVKHGGPIIVPDPQIHGRFCLRLQVSIQRALPSILLSLCVCGEWSRCLDVDKCGHVVASAVCVCVCVCREGPKKKKKPESQRLSREKEE
jgi:hypothetical protein